MRAMSLDLVRGLIDEVDQVVHVTYIKVCAPLEGFPGCLCVG